MRHRMGTSDRRGRGGCETVSSLALCAVSVFAGWSQPVAAKPPGGGSGGGGTTVSYSIVRLAEAEGMVTGINNSGKAVGWIETPAGNQAMLWQPAANGSYSGIALSTTLGSGETATTFDGVAQDINDNGIISGALGDSLTGQGGWIPVVWLSSSDQPKVLPYGSFIFSGAYVEGHAYGICKTPDSQPGLKAVVVGRYIEYPEGVVEGAPAIVHAVAWAITSSDEVRDPVELDLVYSVAGQEFDTVAIDVNSKLEVVGTVASETDIYKHAYRWQLSWNSQNKTLAAVSTTTLFPALQWSSAQAINEQGDICGERAGKVRPFLLDKTDSGFADKAPVAPTAPRAETYDLHAAKALSGNETPHVVVSSTVWTTRGVWLRFADVLWQGASAWDLEKVTPATGIETDYMTCVNDAGVIGGQGWEGTLRRRSPIIVIQQ